MALLEEDILNIKGKDVSSRDDNQWLNDLALLVDITKHIAEIDLKLKKYL